MAGIVNSAIGLGKEYVKQVGSTAQRLAANGTNFTSVRGVVNPINSKPAASAVGGPPGATLLRQSLTAKSLDNDPFKFSTLAYPRDVTQDMANGHYMLFYVNVQNKTKYRYKDFDGNDVGDSIEYEQKISNEDRKGMTNQTATRIVTSTGANAAEVEYARNFVAGAGTIGQVLSSDGVSLRAGQKATGGIASKIKSTTRITDSVAIYLPAVAKDTLGADYTAGATGLAGLAAAGGVDFVQAMQRNDFEGAAKELVGATNTIMGEAVKKSAAGIADLVLGAEGAGSLDIFNKAFGQAENPYMEVVFNNIEMRKFEYSFVFQPRNEDERDDVQAIIKLFRFHMAPELKGSNARYLTLPSTFDIHYMYQTDENIANENGFYSKISTCVLESCDVDYSPDGVSSFADGSPTKIGMTLSFSENELLTKEKINAGF